MLPHTIICPTLLGRTMPGRLAASERPVFALDQARAISAPPVNACLLDGSLGARPTRLGGRGRRYRHKTATAGTHEAGGAGGPGYPWPALGRNIMSRRLAVAAMLAAAPFAVAGAEEITVYTAIEADQLKGYEAAFEAANPDVDIRWVRDSTGDRHRQAPGREGEPARGRGLRPRRHLAHAPAEGGHARRLCAGRAGQGEAADARPRRPALVGRHGCLGLGLLLQHDRGRGQEAAQAGWLGRPRRPDLQGPGGDAQPGLVGHRVSHGLGLAADDGRGEGLGLHGRACTRTSPPTPIPARSPAVRPVPASTRSGSRSSTAPTRPRATVPRSTSCCRKRGSAGTWKRRPSSRAPTRPKRPGS